MENQIKRIFIVAGEPSGDLHGGKLIEAMKNIHPNILFVGHGGENMQKAGMKIIEHVDNISIMGFFEVLKHLPKMIRLLTKTVEIINNLQPDRVILIDYPGFNLRLARKLSDLKIPVTYFILPQAWAWKPKRVNDLKKFTDQALSIFPFEKKWYKTRGLIVNYIGHPFIEKTYFNESFKKIYNKHKINNNHPVLVLLPGSRQQEINKHWPIFLDTIKILKIDFPQIQIVVGKANGVSLSNIPSDFKIEPDSNKAIQIGTAAIVASGTATLECAIGNLPMVVCYKFSLISWWIVKLLVQIKYSTIVNLIENEKIVPELIQSKMTPKNIIKKIVPLLDPNTNKRKNMIVNLEKIKTKLGLPGVYDRAASEIIKKTLFK